MERNTLHSNRIKTRVKYTLWNTPVKHTAARDLVYKPNAKYNEDQEVKATGLKLKY